MKFADQARRMALVLSHNGQRLISRQDLGDRLGIQTRKDMRRVDTAAKALVKSGDLEHAGRGLYRYIGQPPAPSKQEVMWRFLRARRLVTAEDLQDVARATADYVREWLRLLLKQKLVRQEGNNYRLIQDPGPEPPRNESKIAYLKSRREQQKKVLAALDEVYLDAISLAQKAAEARLAVSQMEEE